MKLIITGATGFVATEVLRQALLLPSITTVVAVARNHVSAPEGLSASNTSKLKSVFVSDYDSYPEEVKKEFESAEACIWTVAITPSKSMNMPPEVVHKVCHDYTIAGFKAIVEANQKPTRPMRFLYMSGVAARDPTRPHPKDIAVWSPQRYGKYCKMRGEVATNLFELAEEQPSRVEVCIAKPGLITGGQRGMLKNLFGTAMWLIGAVPTVDVKEIAAAMLHYAVRGFDGTENFLLNAEMVSLGKEILSNKDE